MNKFYVRPAKSPRKSPFTFKSNGFYNVLKSKVNKKLSYVNQSSIPIKSMLVVDTYFIVTLALCVGVGYTQNYVLALLAGAILALGTVVSHNFTHLKDNWRMYYMQLSLMSVRCVLHIYIDAVNSDYSRSIRIVNVIICSTENGEYRMCSAIMFTLIPYKTWR